MSSFWSNVAGAGLMVLLILGITTILTYGVFIAEKRPSDRDDFIHECQEEPDLRTCQQFSPTDFPDAPSGIEWSPSPVSVFWLPDSLKRAGFWSVVIVIGFLVLGFLVFDRIRGRKEHRMVV